MAGELPLADVIRPAIRLAEDGFALSEGEAERLATMRQELAASPTLTRAFLPPSGAPRPGSLVRQPELANTLRAISNGGVDAFYRGELSEVMSADFAEHGGWVTSADLAAYEAEESIIARGQFGALELIGTYIPAMQPG